MAYCIPVTHNTREQLLSTGEAAARARERLCEARDASLQAQTRW